MRAAQMLEVTSRKLLLLLLLPIPANFWSLGTGGVSCRHPPVTTICLLNLASPRRSPRSTTDTHTYSHILTHAHKQERTHAHTHPAALPRVRASVLEAPNALAKGPASCLTWEALEALQAGVLA